MTAVTRASYEGRTTKAAVLRGVGQPLEIEELEIAEPAAGEVMVRLAASGVCHSDYHVVNGDWKGVKKPIVLGHEGAGVVEAVGAGVKRVAVGDRVILSWLPNCGHCRFCMKGRPQLCTAAPETVYENLMLDGTSRLRKGDEIIYSYLTVGSFGELAVVPETGAIPISDRMPLDRAAVVGCAMMTGVGAVTNSVQVPVGSSAAVIGCGGVGLAVIQGCTLEAANPLIAIDTSVAKLAIAKELGATHLVDATEEDPVAAVRRLTDGGADFAFEAIGLKQTFEQATEMLGSGGTAVIVGIPAEGVMFELEPHMLIEREHRLVGSHYGSSNPAIDFPKLVAMYEVGLLDFDKMITRRLPLDSINDAFADMGRGEGVRSVIVYDQ
jgi:S-(hydroxymethyl)glutathione dehydrogenase/alcohol dehydrogenase